MLSWGRYFRQWNDWFPKGVLAWINSHDGHGFIEPRDVAAEASELRPYLRDEGVRLFFLAAAQRSTLLSRVRGKQSADNYRAAKG